MQEELSRMYSGALKDIKSSNYGVIEGMEEHLKKKANQLQRLQQCFQSQIREIEMYENKQRLCQIIINSVNKTFKNLKLELNNIRQIWNNVIEWKEEIVKNFQIVVKMVENSVSLTQKEQKIIKSRVEVNQNQFKRIEMKYREQIQKQSNTIVHLESALKNKSLSKNKYSQSSLNLEKQFKRDSSTHILSCNEISNLLRQRASTNKSVNELKRNESSYRQKHISPTRSLSKHLNKEEVMQKIRRYQKNKIMTTNSRLPKSTNQNDQPKRNFEIPSLPQLTITLRSPVPIANGFDVLTKDGREIYKGMWKKGVFQGRGKYYSTQWIYDGEFRGGNIEGFGTLNFKSSTFIGKFENGQAQGEGTLYCKQKPISGIWKDHVLVKQY